MEKPSQLLKFTRICMHLATEHLPPYSSKFSKHIFTQPQLVTLYCLKLKLRATYRELINWLAEMPRVQEALGLKRLPHFHHRPEGDPEAEHYDLEGPPEAKLLPG